MLTLARAIASICVLICTLPAWVRAESPDRFALLIGVDAQLQRSDYVVPSLKGPGNDVKLVRKLLVEKYGFKDDAAHILTITGEAATAKAIADRFQTHLIDNAKRNPGAIVVFYFSGHGSTTKDHNNDEGDGIDETLVAYDSRGENGKDIIDDQIDKWFEALRVYTSNVTFIFDSCHSGTATRGQAVARSLPPNPKMAMTLNSRALDTAPAPRLPKNLNYTAVAGALANELSYEGDVAEASGTRYGYMTWNLVQTLRAHPNLSWRQALNEIRRGVARFAPGQHPQVEGDVDRTAFGGVGNRAMPYISIIKTEADDKLTIAAGRALGINVGTILAIYAPAAPTLTGDEFKLATARVAEVGSATSLATFLDKPAQRLPEDAKVTIVTPYFGSEPLAVKLDGLADQQSETADYKFISTVRQKLSKNSLVKAATGSQPWLFAIQRGCLDKQSLLEVVLIGEPRVGCRTAYYLSNRQTREPVLGFWTAADDPAASTKVADAISSLARQSSLRALSNKASQLKVNLRLIDVIVEETAAGELRILRQVPRPEGQQANLHIGDYFSFEISNQSVQDVYVALISLGTSGSISVMSPSPNGELVKGNQMIRLQTPLTAGPPTGLETYKIIATTRPDLDFSVLSSPGTTRRALGSPLEWFLAQAGTTAAKDSAAAANVRLNEWTTDEIDIQIRPKFTETSK